MNETSEQSQRQGTLSDSAQYYCCERVRLEIEETGEWRGGSHYHCGNCWELSSMMGHYHSVHYVDGKPVKVEGHFRCSNECDLDKG